MYTPTIGLEIHAELLTKSKLFCGCRNDPNDEEPNMHICPICVGYPGSLPVLNRQAVEHILRIGTALNGTIAKRSGFDRKHYFYPDIPKGYQISQYPNPFVQYGELVGVGITRVHLEEDTAKSSHDVTARGSVIDFNRSGVPLMELVTEPVIHSAEEAKYFGEMLQLTLRYLDVARARMEWGEMRVEVNISLSDTEKLGTKVEIKNLNSFKAVCNAIDFEITRQSALLKEGKQVVQETRGWNENTEKTFSQRTKETSAEYRYMPEPDLPQCDIAAVSEWSSAALAATLPELPIAKLARYTREVGIPKEQADTLIKNRNLADIFDAVIVTINHKDIPRLTANYLLSDVMQYCESHKDTLFTHLNAEVMTNLMRMLVEGELSSRGVKDIIAVIVTEGGDPRVIAEERNLFQQSDEGVLVEVIDKIIQQHKGVADEYRAGKEPALQFLVGQVMKETRGSANPGKVQELLKSRL